MTRLINRREVERRTGLSKATLYRRLREGRFPLPVRDSAALNLWSEEEIDAWIAAKLADRSAAA